MLMSRAVCLSPLTWWHHHVETVIPASAANQQEPSWTDFTEGRFQHQCVAKPSWKFSESLIGVFSYPLCVQDFICKNIWTFSSLQNSEVARRRPRLQKQRKHHLPAVSVHHKQQFSPSTCPCGGHKALTTGDTLHTLRILINKSTCGSNRDVMRCGHPAALQPQLWCVRDLWQN